MDTTLDYGVAGMQALRAQAEAATYPETLGALIDDAAARNGDQMLAKWITDGQTMTYAEYARLTRKLASSLEAQGIRKGTHVGVMLPNVPAFVVTWGALARIGAVMIPVNISYTETELKFVLTDADAQFIVMDQSVVPVWEAMAEKPALVNDARVIVHGGTREGSQDWQALLEAGDPDYVATSTISRTDLLNLQYTSGTTGFPKGCMLSHEYWILLGSLAAKFRGRGGDVKNVLINAPFFYMDPMWQFIMTMVLDGTAKIAPRISLSNLYNWLVDEDIHYCIFPQPGLKAWPEGPEDRKINLRYVSIFGWSVEAREEAERRFGCVARESFGMTEIGGGLMVPPEAGPKAYQRTCGIPAAFREARIVGDTGQDVAQGEIGELWIAGRGLLWGYYKRPDANATGFSGRWFRTGDLFRQDADGFYYIVGRIKDMIRRAGENVAAQEVEAAVVSMEGVWEVAAVGVPDKMRGQEVMVVIRPREGVTPDQIDPEAVIAHCASRLAKFKTPRFIKYIDDFERTVSGKIVKRALVDEKTNPRVGAWDRTVGKVLDQSEADAQTA
ncbi:acyl--CoA ligase [Sulfitobacter pseudonitzschiae]|uniref:Acyl--CoA ligase n=1 Tax=Pseudosulfitobacter pseudonitzschiae TaxID=1402135 RepID=A0A9Q2RWZ0_9RHOB|nr:class I adenylate-forming enzyme family protein [Pseudosulfitobacter pseudonitzschiae]MBM2293935.1 acyl--CoA ligase [Pseudosulfitobacter pseudonitzschiae]MBM2298852.1 acyl--CoA ligase [Pseudosulfitobacter pseudonitzschiae]MBM2303766.1 acyl--CoA ligase [Pseudosulfitobacter pseudonitzschiae]MBM2313549.1 acyl--CoA ligase [Pseudosulfitobacter pseudonitzschiae]MBM2318463.1 acyl--CoA ligase [Pseudosulfitobacter pseudonitzschiae]